MIFQSLLTSIGISTTTIIEILKRAARESSELYKGKAFVRQQRTPVVIILVPLLNCSHAQNIHILCAKGITIPYQTRVDGEILNKGDRT